MSFIHVFEIWITSTHVDADLILSIRSYEYVNPLKYPHLRSGYVVRLVPYPRLALVGYYELLPVGIPKTFLLNTFFYSLSFYLLRYGVPEYVRISSPSV